MFRKSHPNHFQRNKWVKTQQDNFFSKVLVKRIKFCNAIEIVLSIITIEVKENDIDNAKVKTLHATLISQI